MSKSHDKAANGADGAELHHEPEQEPAAAQAEQAEAAPSSDDMVAKVTTVGVIGVGAALFEAALIPGILIGIGAMLVPMALPKLSDSIKPMFRWTVRGTYKAGQKARHAFAEAQEQMHDIVAETKAEAARPTAA